ncbi:MAG: PAC2 family protein, partial [Anaerolineae bacterium]|nr:PAC2 family protein [Anaerolineae bacterium]
AVELFERPTTRPLVMLIGWRQWADAGALSSGLPQYLVDQTRARRIGRILPGGFYLFQIPGTHDLVRPAVKFDEGYPVELETPHNDIYYTETIGRGVLILIGDEPHLDIDRYVGAVLGLARELGIKRIVSFGGVYGELPYDKERTVSAIYSMPAMKAEVQKLVVNLSVYQGGAAIGSYLCRRASEREIEYVALYAFVPIYNVSVEEQPENVIRIEKDYTAWLGVMRRVNFMLKTRFDLTDLEQQSQRLVDTMRDQLDEIEQMAPQLGLREYLARIADSFTEQVFDAPLDDVWADEISKLFDDDASEK